MGLLARLKDLDRRWIFLFVALAVVLPTLRPLQLPIYPSGPVRSLYNTVESLPERSLVLISFDYGPSTEVECRPMAIANLRHAFRRNLRVVTMALWPEGAVMAREATAQVAAEFEQEGHPLKYGVDYVDLGFKAGGEVLLRSVGDDFRKEFLQDMRGTPVDALPLMADVKGWESFGLVITLSAGRPGIIEHIRVVNSQYGRPLGAGVTAVQAPEVYTYLDSGQLVGLMGGLRGAAEYEVLVGRPGTAIPGMDAQSIVHFIIAGFILFANLVYFLVERRGRRRR